MSASLSDLLDHETRMAICDEADEKLKSYEPHRRFTRTGAHFALYAVLYVLETLLANERIAKVGKTTRDGPHSVGCMTVMTFTGETYMMAALYTRVFFARPTVVDEKFLQTLRSSFLGHVDVDFWQMLMKKRSQRPVKSITLRYWLKFKCERSGEPSPKKQKTESPDCLPSAPGEQSRASAKSEAPCSSDPTGRAGSSDRSDIENT